MNEMPVPAAERFGSSETRIANTSATTQVADRERAAAQLEHDERDRDETAPAMSVASSIAQDGLTACWYARKIVPYAPMPMNACRPTETSPP